MAETIDTREERQLLDAVKKATDLVSGGLAPDDAVEKVARDYGFGPGKIRLIGQGYNTGQQLGQWRQPGTNILDKLAAFELCDPDKVIAAIYAGPTPAEKAAADRPDDAYGRPPRFHGDAAKAREKTASYKLPAPAAVPYGPDPADGVRHAFGRIDRAKNAADEARRQAAGLADRVRGQVARVVTYFRKAAHDRLPFAAVEEAAREYIGDPAVALLDMVYGQANLREKRAAATPGVLREPVSLHAEPFTLIKAAIWTAGEAAAARTRAAGLKTEHQKAAAEELRPFSPAGAAEQPSDPGPWSPEAAEVFGVEKRAFGFGTEVAAIALGDIAAHKATHPVQPDDPYGDVSDLDRELSLIRQQSQQAIGRRPKTKLAGDKRAFLGAGLGAAIGSSIGRTMGNVSKTKDDLVDDAWMGLEDPEHENELRKIRAHAMINQLMTDPDDPISGHDPDRVLSAYNEISSTAPRVAANAATLRPALRKRLEGHQEPFEAKELIDIEHGLAKAKMPTPSTNVMGDAPGKLLG